ncbi:MAG: ABC transporter permease, partial [Streptococcus salivarius]
MDFITIIALIVASMLKYSAPLIFTSIGGTFSERGGIVNVGLEGIMVIGAFAGVLFNLTFAESFGDATPWIAAIVAGLVGVLYSLLHAVATINFRADHVVSGTVLNLIAPSLAVFLTRVIYGAGQTPAISHNFKTVSFPIFNHIPFLGKVFFTNVSLVAYVAILVSVASWWLILKTRYGLRLRSVGEHPQAADTLGINVYRMRYYGVMISGFLGGVGGAVYAQLISNNF